MQKSILILSFLITTIFANSISIEDAYVRAVPPNLPNSAAFMKIKNNGSTTVYLQSASSNVAKDVEIHEHTMSNGMMKMQQVKKIKIPAHSVVSLKPGGFHVMLLNLNKKLKVNDKVDFITLNFSDKSSITLKNIPIKSVMMGMKHK